MMIDDKVNRLFKQLKNDEDIRDLHFSYNEVTKRCEMTIITLANEQYEKSFQEEEE